MIEVTHLVSRFLAWPLPKSVCSDLCVTDSKYAFPRSGTNLLTADEAKQMIQYLLGGETKMTDARVETANESEEQARALLASGFKAADELVWLDVKDEEYREYIWADGSVVRVPDPIKVNIKRKPEGDSHRVITKDLSYYIPAGWRAIRWKPRAGTQAYAW